MDPIPPVSSPAPLLHTPMPILYTEPTQSPLYMYPSPVLPLPLSPALGQMVIPPYTPHNGQLWFPTPQLPTYINGGPLYYQPPPLRPASANPNPNLNNLASTNMIMIPSGLPISGNPDHVLRSFSAAADDKSWSTSSAYIIPPSRNLTLALRLSTTIRSRAPIAKNASLAKADRRRPIIRSEEHTSELQSPC